MHFDGGDATSGVLLFTFYRKLGRSCAMKRRRSIDEVDPAPSRKRRRTGPPKSILDLSDEIVLRVLAHLPVSQLVRLDLVSQSFKRLSCDFQLWKAKYHDTYVAPRAKRIPESIRPSQEKLMLWLGREGGKVDWKRQYRIRHNWQRGDALFHEMELAQPPTPAVLARVRNGLIITADTVHGLRLWSQRRDIKKLEAQTSLRSRPTSLAVDDGVVVVGYEDGQCEMYGFDDSLTIRHTLSLNGGDSAVTSIALSMPYLVTMTSDRHIQLHQLHEKTKTATALAVLHGDSPLQPAALSLRCTPRSVIATIAYAFNRLNEGWCLGLQEIKLSKQDGMIESRTASNIDTPLDSTYRGPRQWEITSRSAYSTPLTTPFSLNPEVKSPPTSLSYSHPFLLASLSDNTIMSYIVQSDDQKLKLSSGRRLFGHTSAITSAEVSNRGKAVSVSGKGDEVRVWELEELLTTVRGRSSTQVKRRNAALDVAAALAKRGPGLGLVLQEMKKELAMTRRWVGFDDEQVAVLGERDQRQILAIYDFS